MRNIFLIIVSTFLLSAPTEAQLFKSTQKHQDSLTNGSYYEFWDQDSTLLSARGHFCKGRPCKTWKYYYEDGTRRMKVKYRVTLKIKYYTASGKLDQKGYAVMDYNSQQIHFYWHGRWKFYDNKRKLYRIALFENGNEVKILLGPEDPLYFE